MTHGLRGYWNGCRCQVCKDANAAYSRRYHFGKRKDPYVPVKRARQLLLTFENSYDAARMTQVGQATIYRILSGQTRKIRRSTEIKILARAA